MAALDQQNKQNTHLSVAPASQAHTTYLLDLEELGEVVARLDNTKTTTASLAAASDSNCLRLIADGGGGGGDTNGSQDGQNHQGLLNDDHMLVVEGGVGSETVEDKYSPLRTIDWKYLERSKWDRFWGYRRVRS